MQDLNYNYRIIYPGDKYGLNDCLIYDKAIPAIEFYDADYADDGERFGELGQFITRYYIHTFMNINDVGLNLCGSVAKWSLSACQVRKLQYDLIKETV